jgi:hypothetical protein
MVIVAPAVVTFPVRVIEVTFAEEMGLCWTRRVESAVVDPTVLPKETVPVDPGYKVKV